MRRLPIALAASSLFLTLAACGSSDEAEAPFDTGAESTVSAAGGAAGAAGAGGASFVDEDAVDTSFQSVSAPGPYGSDVGSVVRNHRFKGWVSPPDHVASGQPGIGSQEEIDEALAALTDIELHDYWDPTGDKGIKLIMLNSSATWCTYCRSEYREISRDKLAEHYAEKGVVFFGSLLQNADGDAAEYRDMYNWVRSYGANFPFVIDPGGKLGELFTADAFPNNVIIDAKTMEIVAFVPGGNTEALFARLDSEIAKRE